MIEEAIRQHLIADTTLAGYVGAKVYPVEAPEPPDALFPYIIFSRIDTPRERHLRGECGLARPRFQFDIYSRNYDEVRNIATTLRLTLDSRRNFDMGASGATINVRSIEMQDEAHDSLPPTDGTAKGIRHIRQDYTIWHVESVPAYQ